MKFINMFLPKPPESNIETALRLLGNQKICKNFNIMSKKHNHYMVGTIERVGLLSRLFGRTPKAYFSHYNVKFSNNGNLAMISSNGSVDFLFNTKEEVDMIKKLLTDKFGVVYE